MRLVKTINYFENGKVESAINTAEKSKKKIEGKKSETFPFL